jgi:hypothetical protein
MHEASCRGARAVLRGELDIVADGETSRLRLWRSTAGDAIAAASGPASIDGRPMLGRLAVVGWGRGALLRVGGLAVDVLWRPACGRRVPPEGRRCRLCFGAFEEGEVATVCPCEALFHGDCDDVRVSCPDCGATPGPVEDAP